MKKVETVLPAKVKVFDRSLYKDDEKTPLCLTMKPARIVKRYEMVTLNSETGQMMHYPDLIDVVFDHRPDEVSCGHFTSYADPL